LIDSFRGTNSGEFINKLTSSWKGLVSVAINFARLSVWSFDLLILEFIAPLSSTTNLVMPEMKFVFEMLVLLESLVLYLFRFSTTKKLKFRKSNKLTYLLKKTCGKDSVSCHKLCKTDDTFKSSLEASTFLF